MFKSFRLRVAFLSALLSGFALAGFGAFAWWMIHDIKIRQIDADLISHVEREARRMVPPEAWQRLEEDILPRTLGARDPRHVLLLVEDETGNIVYRSAHWPAGIDVAQFTWPTLPPRPDNTQPDSRDPRDFLRPVPPPRPPSAIYPFHANGTNWRAGLARTPHSRIVIAISLEAMDDDMAAIRNGFLFALPLALAFIGLGAWLVSGRALNPVRRLSMSIHNVTAQGLDQRIATGGEDREFAELIAGFNDMLERLEKSFHQASRFSADAAHELKTPLTILQGQIEHAISQAEAGSPIQTVFSGILDETRRLSDILRKLLLLSQADAGRLRIRLVTVNLSDALNELVEDTKMLAPKLTVTGDTPPTLFIAADEQLLRQVLINLISNAIKYNISEGWIRITAAQSDSHVSIIVSNSSHGIPPESREKIFERFYRVDAAHSRAVEGVGLGLSLSREIARAHGGDLVLKVGTENEVQLKLILPKK
jgi:heavy metal sensor kinase